MRVTNYKGVQVPITFPPSSAHIWGAEDGCRAYARKLKQHPYVPSLAAEEGKKEHALGAEVIKQMGVEMLNGTTLTRTHESFAVQTYLQDVIEALEDHPGTTPKDLRVEKRLYMPSIHQQCKGDVDASFSVPGALYVWDFKNGRTLVEAYKNLQLVCYASALLRELGATPQHYDPDFKVHLRIVQPNGFHVGGPCREWTTSSREIFDLEYQLSKSAYEACDENVRTSSGNHCLWCNCRLTCPSAIKSAHRVLDYVDELNTSDYTPENLGNELEILHRAKIALESRTTAVTTELERALARGVQVTKWRMGEKVSAPFWTDRKQAIDMLPAMGFDVLKTPDICTPLQAVKAGVPKEFIATMSKRSTKSKLLPDDGSWAKKEIENAK